MLIFRHSMENIEFWWSATSPSIRANGMRDAFNMLKEDKNAAHFLWISDWILDWMDLWMHCVLKVSPIPAGRPTYIVYIRTPSAIRYINYAVFFSLYAWKCVLCTLYQSHLEPFHAKLDGFLHRFDWTFVNELVFDEKNETGEKCWKRQKRGKRVESLFCPVWTGLAFNTIITIGRHKWLL